MAIIIKDDQIRRIKSAQLVLAGGCFDVLHAAHIEFLNKSRLKGNALVLLLESDENITKMKGEGRPMNNQNTRAENLSNLTSVDYIILLKNPKSSHYYYNLVKSIKPDIIAVTENDPLLWAKKEQAKLVGGKVIEVMKRNPKHSTTDLLKTKKPT